ncbi:acyltransferase [Candidatus Pseudoruminococcus sp.]|uniref:acyltransferase n=1 Tax=Candidatus Pseudoruminococcus sp. TaxID=3101048 RepID=UPI00399ABCCD|nr:acyltransferase [Ruminococcus sp.]
MQKAQRKSGIELLRIICMLMIIVLHAYTYGGLNQLSNAQNGGFEATSDLIWSFFRTPVNVFMIITGYFMSKDVLDFKKSYRRIPKVYATMLFYSILLTIFAFIVYNYNGFSIPNETADNLTSADKLKIDTMHDLSGRFAVYSIIKMFFPLLSKQWYFLTNYVIILLLSPFINKVLVEIDKKQFKILLGLLFVFLSIYPTISTMGGLKEIFSTTKVLPIEYGKSMISFLFMFIIGAYLKRFVADDEKLHFKYLGYFVGLCIIDFSLYYFLGNVMLNKVGLYNSAVFGQFSNPLVILESVSIFLFFRGFQFKSKVVNYIAGTTIGIYAIHEHPLMRGFIWSHNELGDPNLYNNFLGIIFVVATIFEIFIICSAIDIARQGIFTGVIKLAQKFKKNKPTEKA